MQLRAATAAQDQRDARDHHHARAKTSGTARTAARAGVEVGLIAVLAIAVMTADPGIRVDNRARAGGPI
jgi:hypothetical protein